MTDQTAAIETVNDTQSLYDACLRDSRKTQAIIDRAVKKADSSEGWRSRLFKLAQGCETFAMFEGYCTQAARNVKGDKPKVWTQAQSDIKGAWDKHSLNPQDFDTLESLRRAKIDANKAAKAAETVPTETDSKVTVKIPAQLAAQVDAIVALSAAAHESDYGTFADILETAIASLMEKRDGEPVNPVKIAVNQ